MYKIKSVPASVLYPISCSKSIPRLEHIKSYASEIPLMIRSPFCPPFRGNKVTKEEKHSDIKQQLSRVLKAKSSERNSLP